MCRAWQFIPRSTCRHGRRWTMFLLLRRRGPRLFLEKNVVQQRALTYSPSEWGSLKTAVTVRRRWRDSGTGREAKSTAVVIPHNASVSVRRALSPLLPAAGSSDQSNVVTPAPAVDPPHSAVVSFVASKCQDANEVELCSVASLCASSHRGVEQDIQRWSGGVQW